MSLIHLSSFSLLRNSPKHPQQLAQRLTMDNPPDDYSSLHLDVESGTHNNPTPHNNSTPSKLEEEEATLSTEIHRTISTLTELINDKMATLAERTGRSQHLLLVKRYREILFDCGADFQKTSGSVVRRREARELFRDAKKSTGDGDGGAMEQLLRERNAIDNSMQSANSVLNQASSVRSELRSQGASLRGITGTIGVMAQNIPGMDRLMEKIRAKRLRDDRVVSGVVAGCILFTIWYLFG